MNDENNEIDNDTEMKPPSTMAKDDLLSDDVGESGESSGEFDSFDDTDSYATR